MLKNDIVIHKETRKRYLIIDEFINESEGKYFILKDTWNKYISPIKMDERTLINDYHKVEEHKKDHNISIGDLVTLYNHKTCKYDTYPVKEIYMCEASDIKEHEGKRMYVLHTGEATECLYVSEYALYGVVKCLK